MCVSCMGKSCENAKTVALHRNKVLSGRENISNILILMSNIFLEESSQDNQQCGLGVENCPLEYNKIMIKIHLRFLWQCDQFMLVHVCLKLCYVEQSKSKTWCIKYIQSLSPSLYSYSLDWCVSQLQCRGKWFCGLCQ